MCNGANHSSYCTCGFGGDTGAGGRRGSVSNFTVSYAPRPVVWSRGSSGTVESYVNPNARCPVCRCPVYFYRSPYDGRVFFDELGWPWPKHKCTDTSRERGTRPSLVDEAPREPPWRHEGWTPLLSMRISHGIERSGIRGDFDDRFVDLMLPVGTKVDRESPALIRTAFQDIHEVTFLASDHFSTRPIITIAFDRRLFPVGDATLSLAAKMDPEALYSVGRFLLWDLDDPSCAMPYLEAAAGRGHVEALLDLLTLTLFLRP